MLSRVGRLLLIFMPVFTLSFLAADYFWTGTVTNTWIGIGLIAAVIVGIVRMSLPIGAGPTEES